MATLKQWNYEVSIWTLQDSFITVLKPSNMENKGQLENEDFVIKNDGTLEFSFSIPTWLYLDGERMPNPIWFDSYHGDGIKAILVKNMTKLKVTFNKGRDEEKTFELLITNCEESHENDNVYYNVQSEGMAFHELGKVGYKISLTQDLYDPLYKEWFEGDQTGETPAANLDFWLQTGMGLEMLPGVKEVDEAIKLVEQQHALYSNTKNRANEINSLYRIDQTLLAIRDAGVISRKAFPYYEVLNSYVSQYKSIINKTTEVTEKLDAVIAAPKKVDRNKWYYIIDMDWSAYDSSRDRRKIYEEEYTKSWSYDSHTNKFSAGDIEKAREKWRNEQINLEESNKYNLTQNLAEIFGVFCRYEYIYDENYYIVGRKIIFYNNFAREQENGYLSLTYPYTASKISRTQETTDLVTKMYVKPVDNEHSLSGLSTIVDVGANKMREDYVMNFDYLKLIGTISDEQYAEIENYEGEIRKWNDKIAGLQQEIDNLSNELIKLKAQNQGYIDGQRLAKEQLDQAKDLLESITAKDGTADGKRTIDSSNPKTVILSRDKNNEGQLIAKTKDYYIQVDTLKIYREYDYVNKSFSQNKEIKDFLVDYDDYGNLSYVRVAEKKKDESNENDYALEDGTMLYLTYDYIPKLYYEAVEKIWGTNLDINKKGENETTPIIASKEQLLEEKTEALSNYVKEKEKVIAKFEAMMGPALREGFWQPEGYTDGGDKYIDVVNMPIKIGYENGVPGQSGYTTFFWDTVRRNEDYEIEKNYKIGVNQEEKPYYYIDLWADVINGTMTEEAMNYFIANKDKYSFIFYDCGITPEKDSFMRRFYVGGDVEYGYAQIGNGGVSPVAIITGVKTLSDTQLEYLNTKTKYWGEVITSVANESISIDYANKADITFIMEGDELKSNIFTESDTIVYPRIEVNSPFLKNASDQLIIKLNDTVLENYTDYYILTDDNKYYITIRPEALPLGTMRFNFQISFALSNADTSIYLDSLQVLKENAYPRVSYDIEPGVMDESFLYTAYDRLNQIVNINDFELMLENVQGYISELHINPDKMWETTFEVKNYRNKFEDLFSSIVAQTEEMKKSAYSIGLAANGFNTDGTISADTLNQSLSNNFNIFQAYLESGFDDSTVVRNQLQSIWDEAGAIINDAAHTLYGAHMTTVKNAAYLASFREDVKSALTPSYYTGSQPPTDFKPGDIWSDGVNTYIATTFEGFTKTYDGTLAAIRGANVMYDAQAGVVEITGENNIDIKSGGTLYLGANDTVNIVGNNRVNIGGREICIGAAEVKEVGASNYTTTTSGIHLVTACVVRANKNTKKNEGTAWDNESRTVEELSNELASLPGGSQLHITPAGIEMASSNGIVIKSGAGIDIRSSDNNNVSVVEIDKDKGVYVGGKSVTLYGGPAIANIYRGPDHAYNFQHGDIWFRTDRNTNEDTNIDSTTNKDKIDNPYKSTTVRGYYQALVDWDEAYENEAASRAEMAAWTNTKIWKIITETVANNYQGASVELNSEHLLLGFTNIIEKTGTAIELDKEKIVIAAGNVVDDIKQLQDGLDVTDTLVGAEFTKDKISFATNSTVSGKTFRNLILMDNNGILIGNGRVNSSGKYVRSNGTTTATKMGPPNSENDTDVAEGSYIKISPDKLALGSMADLYVNTNNVKLQTNASASDGSNTILAIGTNLQNINVNTNPATLNSTGVQLLVNKNGLYAAGTIYANAGNIAGWTITKNNNGGRLSSGNGDTTVGLDSGMSGVGADKVAIWAGNSTLTSAPFRVTRGGKLYATDAEIKGSIQAGSVIAETATIGGKDISSYVTDKANSAIDIKVTNEYIEDELDATDYFKLLQGDFTKWDTEHSIGQAFWSGISTTINDIPNTYATQASLSNYATNSKVDNVINGNTGLSFSGDFSTANITKAELNKAEGLYIEGKINKDGTNTAYLRMTHGAMGFFKKVDNKEESLLYFENGDLALSGLIFASGGWIGRTFDKNGKVDGGWKISPGALESADGTVLLHTSSANTEYGTGATFALRKKEQDNTFTNMLVFDGDGNLSITGEITATSGKFTGTIEAQGGWLGTNTNGWIIGTSIVTKNNIKYEVGQIQNAAGTVILSAGIKDGNTSIQEPFIIMKNNSNKEVFKFQNGVLEITGTIHASGGWFGDGSDGWVIGGNLATSKNITTIMDPDTGIPTTTSSQTGSRIQSANNKVILNAGNSSTEPYIIMRKDKDDNSGDLEDVFEYYNGNIAMKGTISASSGNIGGWIISEDRLASPLYSVDEENYCTILNTRSYGTTSNYSIIIGNVASVSAPGAAAFSVTKTGILSASGAHISGASDIHLTSGGSITLDGASITMTGSTGISLTSGNNHFNVTPTGINGSVAGDNSAITFGSGDNTLSIYNSRITGTEAEFTTLYVDQIGSSDKSKRISINDLLNRSIKAGTGPVNSTTCPPGTVYLLYTTSGTSSEPENYTFDGGYYRFSNAVPSSGLQRTISRATKNLNSLYKYVVQYKISSGSQGFSNNTLHIVIGNGTDYDPRETIQTVSISMSNNSSYSPSGEVSLISDINYIGGNGRISFFFDKTTNSDVYFSNLKLTVYGTNPGGTATGPQLCTVYYNSDS